MGKEETRSAVMERGATALTIRGRAWPFLGWGGFGRQGGGGPVGLGKVPSTRFLGKGEICRRLKPLSSSPISPISHLPTLTSTHTPLLFPTYCYTIPSYSPNPTLPPKAARNPRETRTGHTLKFPSDQIPTGAQPATHVIATRQICYDSCIGLIGFRDGGISFRYTTCTECGCGRYTILYYTIPYTYTYTQLTRMFDVYLRYIMEWKERRWRREREYQLITFAFFFYYMSLTTKI